MQQSPSPVVGQGSRPGSLPNVTTKKVNWSQVFRAIGIALSFVFNGHIIVFAARWVIRVCGYVAESALLFAVLWISVTSVAPKLVELFIDEKTMQYILWLALVALALIPEVILGNAIIDVAKHWLQVARNRQSVMAWTWAILFTIPTVLFLILTALTLNMLAAANGNLVQASSSMLNVRCFAGWTYGLLSIVYVGIGQHNQPTQATPDVQQPSPVAPVPSIDLSTLEQQIATLTQQVTHLQQNVTPDAQSDASPSKEAKDSEQSAHDTDATSEGESDAPNLRLVNKQPRPQSKRGEAVKRAKGILAETPRITPTELAKRAGISRSYASQLISQHQQSA
jgi:hypothetical protein